MAALGSLGVKGAAEKLFSTGNTLGFYISPDGATLFVIGNSDGAFAPGTRKFSTIMWWRNWAQSLSKD